MPQVASAGAWAAALTDVTPALPASLVSGNLLLLLVCAKPPSAPTLSTAGWTKYNGGSTNTRLTSGTISSGNTEAQGADAGPIGASIWYRTIDGTETAPTVSVTSGSPVMACMVQIGRLASETADRPLMLMGNDGGAWQSPGAATSIGQYGKTPDAANVKVDYVTKLDDLFFAFIGASGNTTFTNGNIVANNAVTGSTTSTTTTAQGFANANLSTTVGNDGAVACFSSLVTAGGDKDSRLLVHGTLGTAETHAGYVLQIRAAAAPLPAPTGLTTSVGLEDKIDVTWAAVAGATGYRVRFEQQDFPYVSPSRVVTGTSVTFSADGVDQLEPGWHTSVFVAAINSDGLVGAEATNGTTSANSAVGPVVDIRLLDIPGLNIRHFRKKTYSAKYQYFVDGAMVAEVDYPTAFPFDLGTITAYPKGRTLNFQMRQRYLRNDVLGPLSPARTMTLDDLAIFPVIALDEFSTHNDSSVGVDFVGGTTLESVLTAQYLVAPTDKSKYLEITHQGGEGRAVYGKTEAVLNKLVQGKVFDLERGCRVAWCIDILTDPAKSNVYVSANGRRTTTSSVYYSLDGMAKTLGAADFTGDWVEKPMTIAQFDQEDGGFFLRDEVNKDPNPAAYSLSLQMTEQALPDNSAPTGTVKIRIYGIFAVLSQRDMPPLEAAPTASTDLSHRIDWTFPAQPSGLHTVATVENQTDQETYDGQSDGYIGGVNLSTTVATVVSADPAKIYEPGTYFPWLYGPDVMRSRLTDNERQTAYVPLVAGLPLPNFVDCFVRRSGDGAVAVTATRSMQGMDLQFWRARKGGPFQLVHTVLHTADPPFAASSGQPNSAVQSTHTFFDSGLILGAEYEYKCRQHYPPHNSNGPFGGVKTVKAGRLLVGLPDEDLAITGVLGPATTGVAGARFDQVNDGYLTVNELTLIEAVTSLTSKSVTFDFGLPAPPVGQTLDTVVPSIWLSLERANLGAALNYWATFVGYEFTLWQGSPGVGTLISRRWALGALRDDAVPHAPVLGLNLSETTVGRTESAIDLIESERVRITDLATLSMRVRIVGEIGGSFAGFPDGAVGSFIFRLPEGNQHLSVDGGSPAIDAGRLRITGNTGGAQSSAAVIQRVIQRAIRRSRIKFAGASATGWVWGIDDSGGGSGTRHRVEVRETSVAVIEYDSSNLAATRLSVTGLTTTVVGDEIEVRYHADKTISVYRNGVLLGTSTAMTTGIQPYLRLVNLWTGSTFFSEMWSQSEQDESIKLYEIGYGVPTADPNDTFLEKVDSDAGTAVLEKPRVATSALAVIPPDVIVAVTNMTGSVANVRDDPATPDGVEIVGGNGSDIRLGFELPQGDLTGEQKFRLRLREP